MNTSSKLHLRFGVIAAMILLAAFSRIIPHMPNFSPLGAIGLFGAAYFEKKWHAFLVPVAATWLSDLFINNVIYAKYYMNFTWFYSGFYWMYGTYILIVIAGIFMLKKITVKRVVAASIVSTAIFYLVTNFICWPGNAAYSQNFEGLMSCYATGIPFLSGTFLGDLFYSSVLFGGFKLAQRHWPALKVSFS